MCMFLAQRALNKYTEFDILNDLSGVKDQWKLRAWLQILISIQYSWTQPVNSTDQLKNTVHLERTEFWERGKAFL